VIAKDDKYLPVDKATFAYMAVLSLVILIFHRNLEHWWLFILINLGVCAAVVLIVRAFGRRSGSVARLLRHWYPLLFFILLYEETRYLIHLVFPHSFDFAINRFELALFGVHPTVWMQRLISPGLNEYMMFAYASYYLLLLVMGIGLYRARKVKEFDGLLFTAAVAYYISYLGFVLVPVEGPRFALANAHQVVINGGFFTSFALGLIHKAGIQGAAMPSSHVAVALVVLVYARRYHRMLYRILFPLVVSLLISTVYGRFHYVSDVAAGLLVGTASIMLCDRLLGETVAQTAPEQARKEFSLDLAASD
jgi:membrane-associated phospholipid phosphatase